MNRKLILSLLSLISLTYGYAQPKGSYNLNFELSKKDFADTIAIEFRNDQVYVPVIINEKQYNFLLDTGSGHAVVYDDMRFDGCETIGVIETRDAIGRKDTVEMVSLPPVTLGNLTLKGCQATVQQRAVIRPGVDGILGFDLVCKGMLMKIDTKNKQLILTDQKKLFSKEKAYEVKYQLNYHVPFLNIRPFEGHHELALFDTGSRHLYSMNKQSFDQGEQASTIQIAKQIEGRSIGRHAIGLLGTEPLGEVVFLHLDSLCLGKFSFGDLHALTTQGGSHIGAKILEYGTMTFNPKRKRINFIPYDGSSRCMVGNEQLQKAIINENGLPVVGLVWERSKLYEGGLRQGDVILKADNQPIRSFAEYTAFRPLIGHLYTFILKDRKGFMKEVKMNW